MTIIIPEPVLWTLAGYLLGVLSVFLLLAVLWRWEKRRAGAR